MMRRRTARPCAEPGCPALVTDNPRCTTHRREKSEQRNKDPEQRRFYGSARWKALRKVVLSRDPVCQTCHNALSEQVHHKDGNWRNNDIANLEGICKACHASESGRQHREKQGNVSAPKVKGSTKDGEPIDPGHHWNRW